MIDTMAVVPSDTLNAYLSSANAGIWVQCLSDSRMALVCNIPETAIKAIRRELADALAFALSRGFQVVERPA